MGIDMKKKILTRVLALTLATMLCIPQSVVNVMAADINTDTVDELDNTVSDDSIDYEEELTEESAEAATDSTLSANGIEDKLSEDIAADDVPVAHDINIVYGDPSEYGEVETYYYDEDGNQVFLDFTADTDELDMLEVSLPTSFDLRNDAGKNYVAEVIEDQQATGTCWAHSGLDAVESNLIKKGLVDRNTINLSEAHLAWFCRVKGSNPQDILANEGYDEFDKFDGKVSSFYGGSTLYITSSLAAGIGAVNEAELRDLTDYNSANLLMKNNKDLAADSSAFYDQLDNIEEKYGQLKYQSDYILTDVTRYNINVWKEDGTADLSRPNALKAALMEKGAIKVSLTLNQATSGTYGKYSCYYNKKDTKTNHAVLLVGWDDGFSKNNFKDTPPGDGAWLLKNSWGSDFSDNGYFYVSYYDTSIQAADSIEATRRSDYGDTIYQYYHISSGFTYYYTNGIAGQVIYKAEDNNPLTAVGIEFWNPNIEYTIEIKTGVTPGQPSSGQVVESSVTSGTQVASGYHVIKLANDVAVKKGEYYSVTVKYPQEHAYLVRDMAGYKSGTNYYTWYKDGVLGTWQDLYTTKQQDLAIRVLTKKNAMDKVYSVDASVNSGAYATAKTLELRTFTDDADIYYTEDGSVPSETNGNKYTSAISLGKGHHIIKAVAVKSGMEASRVTCYEYDIEKEITQYFEVNGVKTPYKLIVGKKYTEQMDITTAPEDFSDFGGWFIDEECRYKLTTAKYVTDRDGLVYHAGKGGINITFDPAEGTLSLSKVLSFKSGDIFDQLPVPKRKGYTFDGWYYDKVKLTKGMSLATAGITVSTAVTAKWTENKYSVSFDPAGGSTSDKYKATSYNYTTKINGIPDSTSSKAKFLGWYYGDVKFENGKSLSDLSIASNITFKAKWDSDKPLDVCEIKFSTEGGAITKGSSSMEISYNTKISELPRAEKTGYEFDGWYYNGKKLKEGYSLGQYGIKGDATIKAVYKLITLSTGQRSDITDVFKPIMAADPTGKYRVKAGNKLVTVKKLKDRYWVVAKKPAKKDNEGIGIVVLQKKNGKNWEDVDKLEVSVKRMLYVVSRADKGTSKERIIKFKLWGISDDYNTYRWYTKPNKVADVNPDTGEITYKKKGKAKITMYVTREGNTKKYTWTVKVKEV